MSKVSCIEGEEDVSDVVDRFQSTWESSFQSSTYFHPLTRSSKLEQQAVLYSSLNMSVNKSISHSTEEPLEIEKLPEANPLLMPSKPCDFLPRILIHDFPYSELPYEVNKSIEGENDNYQANSSKKQTRLVIDQSEPDSSKMQNDIDLTSKQIGDPCLSNTLIEEQTTKEVQKEINFTLYSKYEQQLTYPKVYAKYKYEKSIEELKSNYAGRNFDLSCAADFSNSMFTTMMRNGTDPNSEHEIDPEFDLYSQIDKEKKDEFSEVQKEITFDSRFECGNLLSAFQKIQNKEYDLIIENDTNSKGYSQWFFFKVENHNFIDATVTFNIVNISKGSALYNLGMKPTVFSQNEYQQYQNGWTRNVSNVLLKKNTGLRMESDNSQSYYSLSFTYTFTHKQDTVYFAMNIPYSYSKMITHLNTALLHANQKTIISNNAVPILTITERSAQIKNDKKQLLNQKKSIIWIIARQHPGETAGSYKMEGVIDYILSQAHEAKLLRSKFIFKIIPMMNPDGVIYGNMRCDLSGVDINRSWISPSKVLNPTIYYTKRAIQQSRDLGMKMQFFIDLHGHSKKIENDEVSSRVFPGIMASICSKFSFKDCTFSMEEYKESAARIVIWNELNRPDRSLECCNIFTIETSFFGYGTAKKPKQFSIRNLVSIGQDVLKSIYIDTVQEDFQRYPNVSKQQIITSIERYDFSSNKFKQESGSDSDQQSEEKPLQTSDSPQKQDTKSSLDFKIIRSNKSNSLKQQINRPIFPSPINFKNKLLPQIIEQQEMVQVKVSQRQKKGKQEAIKIMPLEAEFPVEITSVTPAADKLNQQDILKYLECTPSQYKEAFPQRALSFRKAQGAEKLGQGLILLKERHLKKVSYSESQQSNSSSPQKRVHTPKFNESPKLDQPDNSPTPFRKCSSKLFERQSGTPAKQLDNTDQILNKRRSPYLLPISLQQIQQNNGAQTEIEVPNFSDYFAVQKRENVLLQNINIIPKTSNGDNLTQRISISSRLSHFKEESNSVPRSIRPSYDIIEQKNNMSPSPMQSSTVGREIAISSKLREYGISAQTEQGRTKIYYGTNQSNSTSKEKISAILNDAPQRQSKNPFSYNSPQKRQRRSAITSLSENRSEKSDIHQDESFEDLQEKYLSEKSQRMKYISKKVGILENRVSINSFSNNASIMNSFEVIEEPLQQLDRSSILIRSPLKSKEQHKSIPLPLPLIPLSRETSRVISKPDNSAVASEFNNSPKNGLMNKSDINEDFHRTNEIFISKHKAQALRSVSVRNRISFTKLQQNNETQNGKKEEEKVVRHTINSSVHNPSAPPKPSLTSHIPIKIANCLHNKRNRAQINNIIYNQK